jgi:Uma2 family endonuclease
MEKTLDRLAPALVAPAIYYPESDGKPMGETDFHIAAMLYLLAALRHFFRQAEHLYVAADMLFYYEEGNPAAFVVLDVYVVKGVRKYLRRIYKLWEERVAPCVVFEITSRSSRFDDLDIKRALYERLGVNEYFVFDPVDEYLSPRLQGFRLAAGRYRPMMVSPDGTLRSEQLGLILRPEGPLLRLVDPATGQALLTLDEAVDLAQAQAERARVEAERARSQAERAQVEAEHARAEAERADRAEAELARLRAEFERVQRSAGGDADTR